MYICIHQYTHTMVYMAYKIKIYVYTLYIYMGDGGFATNRIATARISVVYNCQLY